MKKERSVTALVILDGVGYRSQAEYNAIDHAKMPHFKAWLAHYPHTFLNASGSSVGLPEGYTSNSEVGHFTIGAGRIVKQSATRIADAIDDKRFFSHPELIAELQKIKRSHKTLHIMGLLSNAGIHSQLKHLEAFLEVARQQGLTNVVIHAFLDGRDAPPKSAALYLNQLSALMAAKGIGILGSIHGRFYAMDRDRHWDRIEKTYRVLTNPEPILLHSWRQALDYYYNEGITDEFIPPTPLAPYSTITDGDGIIFFNFRPDRARQLTAAFVDPNFAKFTRKPLSLSCFITPILYDTRLPTIVLFPEKKIANTFKDALSAAGRSIFAIAESEKYAHVTYFFDGGSEEKHAHETRVLIPSSGAQSYASNPAMSAPAITDAVIASLEQNPCDFYLINYANADMVGHSGDFQATITALECIDIQLGKLFDQIVTRMDGTLYITADHGKAEDMYDAAAQQPRTSHTNNPVPFIMITKNMKGSDASLPLKGLADIAPWILQHMGIAVPPEMQ